MTIHLQNVSKPWLLLHVSFAVLHVKCFNLCSSYISQFWFFDLPIDRLIYYLNDYTCSCQGEMSFRELIFSWSGWCSKKYQIQGCALSKIEGSPVLWTCEIQCAQHMISMKKLRFSSRPRTKVRRHGPPGSARAQPWNHCWKRSNLAYRKEVFNREYM